MALFLTTMKARKPVLVGIALVVIVGSLLLLGRRAPRQPMPMAVVPDAAGQASAQRHETAVGPTFPASIAATIVPTPACTKTTYTPQQLAAADPAFVALDAAEAQWLASNGYPTHQQLDAPIDSQLLEDALRNNKNVVAGVLLGHEREKSGDIPSARSAFSVSGRHGSLYGYMKSNTIEAEHGRIPDEWKMSLSAHMRVAEQLGDHRAGYYTRKYAGDLDTGFWGDNITENASSLLDQVRKSDKTLPYVKRTPRPNKEKWEQALSGGGIVEVCVR